MYKEDILKIAFITHQVIYAYKKMTFELINAGAIYQWMMNYVFRKQLGRNIKVCVDGMIVKSAAVQDHLDNFGGVFLNHQELQHTFESDQVHLQSRFRQIPWLSG